MERLMNEWLGRWMDKWVNGGKINVPHQQSAEGDREHGLSNLSLFSAFPWIEIILKCTVTTMIIYVKKNKIFQKTQYDIYLKFFNWFIEYSHSK